ncbi:ShlB/FhaC/HecB family hemolysin secretion/activation protein [Pseudomonas sp. JQ170]|uniref:ShlB/FhaC/HecB family hemolysin secretion/activation protein n=1 Tax=unclassified Pseudomonas TaxID=196821 RepID=UPI00264AC652|nr:MULTISPECIES: ShlB/FhaC/HecB family hemolysin secretion/activation protein [unclassified Pseudomonas]MDN7143432.1 ShlB/FhaC/HecB family hemolysin secretion/activation protein [Pseudomonas sp. JQ170]WRO73927.1 ShlB/FhaC/HecB family hemolysin secretion/activation protein [Pseudomonas sp. 170C]
MNTFAQKSALALCIAVALAVQPVLAAPLSGLDPGRVETPGPDGRRSPVVEMPGSLELSPTRVSPPAPEVQAPAQPRPLTASSTRFKVSKVILDGADHYPQGTFASLLKGLEGRQVTLGEVNAVTDQITQRYRDDGFLLVRTFVPAQKVDKGLLRLQVVEGKVNQVKISGPSNKAVERYAANIRNEAPLTGKTLERNLLLMNDLSGVDSRAVLSPSSVGPGTDLDVANELRRWEGFIGFDNRDSRYFGPWQVYGGIGLNDPLGLGDHLSLRLGRSVEGDKMAFYEGQYELPLGSQGTVLSVLAQHNDGNADTFDFLNANSSGDTLAVRIAHPWIRTRAETFKTSAAFTWFNGKAEYLDDPDQAPSSDDRIRALRLGASWDFTDRYGGRNLLKAEVSKGLDVLGASDEGRANPSREGGQTDFTKLQYDAQRIQDLSKVLEGLNLYLALTGQTAFGNALLSPEQFGVGGSQFGRGYDPSEIAADNGIAGKVELQYNTAHQVKDYRVPTQYYGFWDVGKVWNNSPDYFGSQSLSSAGFGAHFQVAKDMYLSPELAFPLTRSVSAEELEDHNGKEPRLYFNFLKLF